MGNETNKTGKGKVTSGTYNNVAEAFDYFLNERIKNITSEALQELYVKYVQSIF